MTAKAPVGGKRPFRLLAGISRLSDLADGAGAGDGQTSGSANASLGADDGVGLADISGCATLIRGRRGRRQRKSAGPCDLGIGG